MFQLWFCHYFRNKSFVFLEVESKCLVPTEWPLYVPIVQTRYRLNNIFPDIVQV